MAGTSLQSVVLTRESVDNKALSDLLLARGFKVVDYPCLVTRYFPEAAKQLAALGEIKKFKAVAFGSRRGVRGAVGVLSPSETEHLLIAAVGDGTAAELSLNGFNVNLIAHPSTGEQMACDLAKRLVPGDCVLNVRGNETTGDLMRILSQHGIEVFDWIVYRTESPVLEPLAIGGPTVVVFASPSTARHFFTANPKQEGLRFVAIGPTTEKYLKDKNIVEVKTAKAPDNQEILECVLEWRNEESQ